MSEASATIWCAAKRSSPLLRLAGETARQVRLTFPDVFLTFPDVLPLRKCQAILRILMRRKVEG